MHALDLREACTAGLKLFDHHSVPQISQDPTWLLTIKKLFFHSLTCLPKKQFTIAKMIGETDQMNNYFHKTQFSFTIVNLLIF